MEPTNLRRSTRCTQMHLKASSQSDPSPPETRAPGEHPHAARQSAEQVALADAWRAVDNAVRSIFELARSLEFLSDAIHRVEAEPLLDYQESDYSRYRA